MAGDEPLEELIRPQETPQETLRRLRYQAWDEGYQACYEGQRRHNPYWKKENN